MKPKLYLIIVLLFCCNIAQAQFSKYLVRLKNKTGTPFTINNPIQFLTQKAIDRRIRYSIPLDATDLPIPPKYIDSIRLAGNVTIIHSSKWLNQVCIATNDAAALAKINGFDFVISTSGIVDRVANSSTAVNKKLAMSSSTAEIPTSINNTADVFNYGQSYNQIHLHNADFLHNYGFRGEGMQMTVFDGGFFRYLTLPTFDSVRLNNQILGTWDFVTNDNSVNEDDAHGMKCFSTIAANLPGSFVGSSPAAKFYLYRTEDVATEYPIEEHNWAVAAERADSLGVDVFTTSLGYTTFDNALFNYTYADMTGNKTMMARAANFAAKKGILVVAAAGNDGNNAWRYVATQGDADSTLTIGAVNIAKQVAGFSSYGPNSDGQIKPDVAAVGSNAVVASSNTGLPVFGSGTSFATPIMAGIATCLWQAFPELNNLQIIQALRSSSDRFTNPDDRTGYGIPDIKKAFVETIKLLHKKTVAISNCAANFNFTIKAADNMQLIIERKLPSDNNYVRLTTQRFTGSFSNKIFTYTDSLNNFTGGVNISYRYKMIIGSDTSFYVDSTTLAYTNNCSVVSERNICPNSPTYFSVNTIAGYSYKWQVNNGNGFIDILPATTFYAGSNTNTLLLLNVPANFYGYQYRCIQTNGANAITSNPITLKFSTTWLGTINTAWEEAGNWSCGMVPTANMDVVIKNTTTNNPIVSSAAICKSLSTLPNVAVTVTNGFSLQVVGK
jgi:serine protease AprX